VCWVGRTNEYKIDNTHRPTCGSRRLVDRIFIMVYYPVPKYIKKSALRRSDAFAFNDIDKRADQVAIVATCMRCAQKDREAT